MPEISPQPHFLDHYPLPEDQIAFEMQLQEDYARQFPESRRIMDAALSDIKCAAGIHIPKYKISEIDVLEAIMNDDVDGLGYLAIRFYSTSAHAMVLTMPKNYTAADYAAMQPDDYRRASYESEGMAIVGELPMETKGMLESIYRLIGASVVRDQRSEGSTIGSVIRHGVYQASDVWVSEDFDDNCLRHQGNRVLQVRLLGAEIAAWCIEDLNEAQRAEFEALSGITRYEYIDTVVAHDVDRHNYKHIAAVLGAARAIIDGQGS